MRKHFADSGPGRGHISAQGAADQSHIASTHIADSGGHACAATVDVTSIAAAALALGPS